MGFRLVLIETNVANTASVVAALRRLGVEADPLAGPADVARAEGVILPGVGAFSAGMASLREQGLIDPLRERIGAGRPTLAICLGMQMLCAQSEESPGTAGLGVVDETIEAYPDSVIRPQMGWNRVEAPAPPGLMRTGYAYFANRYRLASAPDGWSCSMADYGGRFVAAMQRGDVLACQFHPELSGRWGLDLIDRWLSCALRAERKEAAAC